MVSLLTSSPNKIPHVYPSKHYGVNHHAVREPVRGHPRQRQRDHLPHDRLPGQDEGEHGGVERPLAPEGLEGEEGDDGLGEEAGHGQRDEAHVEEGEGEAVEEPEPEQGLEDDLVITG